MITIQTDIAGMILQNTLSDATKGLNFCINNLTSGYKINHAKDNAANYSISTKLATKISSMLQVQSNADQGLDMLSTAEGGLAGIQKHLERLREMAIQASSGTYDAISCEALQAEADALIEQIEQIKNSIQYNGMNLYEAPLESASAVTKLAKSARVTINGNNNLINNINDITFTPTAEESVNSSPAVSSLLTPKSRSVASSSPLSVASATPSSNDGIMTVAEGDPITGVESFGVNETRTIDVDGVEYTVTNRNTTTAELSYTKDSTGLVTFVGNYFTIKGQTDVTHNLAINGRYNYIYGGDLNDSIVTTGSNNTRINKFYGGKGSDYLCSDSLENYLYGEDDNDTIIVQYADKCYGGDGDDDITVSAGMNTIYGDAGNDTITLKADSNKVYAGDGNDEIILTSGKNNVIDGQGGVNTFAGDFTNNTVVNVEGAVDFVVEFGSKETKTVNINGIDYEITNNQSSAQSFYYKIDSTTNQISFLSKYFTIVGDKTKEHNVSLRSSNITFHGGDLKDIIEIKADESIVYAYEGDNEIIENSGYSCKVYAGDGNNKINTNSGSYGSYWYLGNGNNTVTLSKNSRNQLIYAGSGNNTITDNGSGNFYYGFGDADNCSVMEIGAKETKNISINNINYNVYNRRDLPTHLFYKFDPVTNQVTLAGSNLRVTGQEDVAHDVVFGGQYNYFYGGEKDDKISYVGVGAYIYGKGGDDYIEIVNGTAYGGDGNDTLVANGTGTRELYGENGNDTLIFDSSFGSGDGGEGDDTFIINYSASVSDSGGNNIYEVNANNVSVTGGDGNDSFYVKGSNCTISGGAGDDYFVVESTGSNTINGGTGSNYYVDNSNGNATFNEASPDPNSGSLQFTSLGEEKNITLDGFEFTIKNNGNSTNNTNNLLKYSYNQNTKEFTFNASAFTITALNGAKVTLNGSNNILNGSEEADNINIKTGSNNIVNGLGGNDTIVMNSANNSIQGGDGADNITLNESTNLEVNAGDGNNTLNIISSNNTNIIAGNGNDSIKIDGSGNTIKANDGNNTFTINNTNNNISATSGNNDIVLNSSDNTVMITGNGNNTLGLNGNNNLISAGNLSGNTSINGNGNEVTSTNGTNTVTITGSNNTYSTTNGDKKVIIKGSDNTVNGGSGNDNITLQGDNNNIFGGDGNDSIVVRRGSDNNIDGQGGNNTIVNNGNSTTITNATEIKTQPFELKLKVDIGSGDDTYIKTTIGFNMIGFSVDFSSRENALDSLEQIDALLKTVNEQILNIGTVMNRLVSVIEAQSIKIENLVSTQSTIRDADIAEESSNYIKYQILQQASAALMASTSKIRKENVLGLLQGLHK